MNRKSLKQMSLSDPGLLAAQSGKRLWAIRASHGSTVSSTVNPVEPVEAFGDQSDQAREHQSVNDPLTQHAEINN
jgi:hypothetical protein